MGTGSPSLGWGRPVGGEDEHGEVLPGATNMVKLVVVQYTTHRVTETNSQQDGPGKP